MVCVCVCVCVCGGGAKQPPRWLVAQWPESRRAHPEPTQPTQRPPRARDRDRVVPQPMEQAGGRGGGEGDSRAQEGAALRVLAPARRSGGWEEGGQRG